MANQNELYRGGLENSGPQELELSSGIGIRLADRGDYKGISQLARKNFTGPSFSLFPLDVVNAYVAANRTEDVMHAAETEGSEAYVAEDEHNSIVGFLLIRHNQVIRRNAYGDLDLRRLHVDPTIQGKGIGSKLFEVLEKRAQDLQVSHITTHASGGSRPFFESHGWEGETTFNDMTKRGRTRAIVFAAQKRIVPDEIELFPNPSHIIYAGSNDTKAEFVKDVVHRANLDAGFVKYSNAEENEMTNDVVEAAFSKAVSAARQIRHMGNYSPLIIAGDVRADLLVINGTRDTFRYDFLNRGKPKGATDDDKLRLVSDNFTELLITSEETKKPAPYIIRSATCIVDPKDPSTMQSYTSDSSVWLSGEGLAELASIEGVKKYREEAMETLGADIFDMSGGFCLPIFLQRGYVTGINGHPIETLPKKDQAVNRALHTAIVGIDERFIRRRLGIIE